MMKEGTILCLSLVFHSYGDHAMVTFHHDSFHLRAELSMQAFARFNSLTQKLALFLFESTRPNTLFQSWDGARDLYLLTVDLEEDRLLSLMDQAKDLHFVMKGADTNED